MPSFKQLPLTEGYPEKVILSYAVQHSMKMCGETHLLWWSLDLSSFHPSEYINFDTKTSLLHQYHWKTLPYLYFDQHFHIELDGLYHGIFQAHHSLTLELKFRYYSSKDYSFCSLNHLSEAVLSISYKFRIWPPSNSHLVSYRRALSLSFVLDRFSCWTIFAARNGPWQC